MIDHRGLQAEVLARLHQDPRITAAHLGVTATAGVVSITGQVDSFGDRHAAELVLRDIVGMRAIVVAIDVRLSARQRHGDHDIALAAAEGIAVPGDGGSVVVRVEKGWVTLSGQVPDQTQRGSIEAAIRRLDGVSGLTNQITVTPKVSVRDVSADIAQALRRSWFFDANPIHVSAEGGTVRLAGTVGTPADRDVASSIASAGIGVIDVENCLHVIGGQS